MYDIRNMANLRSGFLNIVVAAGKAYRRRFSVGKHVAVPASTPTSTPLICSGLETNPGADCIMTKHMDPLSRSTWVWVWSSSEFPNPLLKPREERIPSHDRRRQRKSVDRRLCTVGKQSSSLSRLLIEAAVAEAELWPLVMSICAYLGFGRSIHSLEFKMGFDLYTHVSNALISMYAKSGNIEKASYVFESIPCRDLISWNSMISGFSQHGLAKNAVDLLNQMDTQNVTPDAISYLCVLSSCRHVGLVEQGRRCFDLMLKRGLNPELDHYSCIVDLLGRAGLLEEALDVIKKMPIHPNAVIWGSLLSSCRVHRNVWIGIHAAENRLLLEPGCAATYVQLANLYASAGYWNHAAKVRKLMKERGLRTSPGYSWIEIGNKVYNFKAEDRSNNKLNEILKILDSLACHMELFEYTTVANIDLQYEEIPP
ncbi:hypothetical protein B296_00008309 [Ensete ventricosum]|uniref:DYW domain-containing protein n=1 Tax=Ensete ventricosum TaxID=4639 RepID=A0A427AT74_ENSVE|nr:hypothetical protein B296_00008309 [Ensete ventricosum]